MSMDKTIKNLEEYIAEELGITKEEVDSLFHCSENVIRNADAKCALNQLIKANRLLSKIYAVVKSQLSQQAKIIKNETKRIIEIIFVYNQEIKDGKIPKNEASTKDIETYNATSVDITSYTLQNTSKMKDSEIRTLSKTIANAKLSEIVSNLESQHIVVAKLIDMIDREINCMNGMVRLLTSEQIASSSYSRRSMMGQQSS